MNIKEFKKLDKSEILAMLGLETKASTVGWLAGVLGAFGAGLLFGAGLALVLAPKPGRELRGAIRERLRHRAETIDGRVQGHSGPDSPCRDAAAS